MLRVDGAKRGALKAQLVGIGAAAPKTRVSNAQLETVVETSDEWIAQRTGIRARHVLAPGEGLVELASDAVTQALEQAGVDPLEVELVIMATSTPGACCAAAAALRSFSARSALLFLFLADRCFVSAACINNTTQTIYSATRRTSRARSA